MKKIVTSPIFWIFLLALFLRIYKLGEFPVGFHADEARVGWNALSIMTTGKDDHLNTLPLYYDSFGDFRPSGIFYFAIPSILLFGKTVFATRFSVALFGALTVVPIYLLINLISEKKKKQKAVLGFLAAFLWTISPWSIELSRATNEVVISVFFALFALYFFVKLIKSSRRKYGLFSASFITISYLLYHSTRFLGPLFLVATSLYYFKEIKSKNVGKLVIANVVITILLTAYFGLAGKGLARFNQTSILGNVDVKYELQRIRSENTSKNIFTVFFDNKYVIFSKKIINEYGSYFSPEFLLGYKAQPYRFTTPGAGLFTYAEIILIFLGLAQIIRRKNSSFPAILLLLAPLPASLTLEESPNLSRAFFMCPFLIIIAAYGFYYLINEFKIYKKPVVAAFFIFLALNFSYFAWMYLHHSQTHKPFLKEYFVDSPTYRNVGAIELVKKLDLLSANYDKIILTNFPDNPYPWYAYFTGKSPLDFNKTYREGTKEIVWGNIIFSEEKCPSDDDFWKFSDQNILVVDSWECGYESQISAGSPMKVLSKITRSDASEVYILLERDWDKEFPKEILERIRQISKK